MIELLDLVLVAVLLQNFLMLGTSRLRAAIQFAGIQGVLVGAALYIAHSEAGLRVDRKSTRLNSSHLRQSRMPSSA